MLCMTKNLHNSSVKQPIGASPVCSETPSHNTIHHHSRDGSATRRTVATFNSNLRRRIMTRQARTLQAAALSQQRTDDENLWRRYASYKKCLLLITAISQVPITYGFQKTYMIQNLVTSKEYFADVTHSKLFYYNPLCHYISPH